MSDLLDGLKAGSRLPVTELENIVQQLLGKTGMESDTAGQAARLILYAQRTGIDSHGAMHLPSYVRRLLDGTINPSACFKFNQHDGATTVLDADAALGCLAAATAMQEAMRRADIYGVGVIAVRNSSHFGPAGAYVHAAADAGYVALGFSNASPTMAPWGGRRALLGTNPLAAGFPRQHGPPVVIDMASTAGSRAAIRQSANTGEPIPAHWALDADGYPTTDAHTALDGTMQPVGGAKGYGLALMVELLCSALAGGVPGYDVRTPQDRATAPCRVSHCFVAIKSDAFGDAEALIDSVESITATIEASEPRDAGDPIRIPGARRAKHLGITDERGIELTEPLLAALHEAQRLVSLHA